MMKFSTLLVVSRASSLFLLIGLWNVRGAPSFAFVGVFAPKTAKEQQLRQQQQQQQHPQAFVVRSRTMSTRRQSSFLTDTDDSAYEPYFQMQQIPTATATTTAKLDRIVHCAENGEMCNVEEMMEMMEELERLNLECTEHMSRECSLDAIAARNVLKVALAHHVAASECNIAHLYDDPYAEMNELHDECINEKMIMHRIPTATAPDSPASSTQQRLDHIVECAENGQSCNVQEMTMMIEELERLNMDCHHVHGSSRECLLDAVEARNILKVALASQVAAQQEQQQVGTKVQ